MTPTEALDDELMVFIAGAGIAGLLLGALLQKARIQYHIFERATEVKPLGKAATCFLSFFLCFFLSFQSLSGTRTNNQHFTRINLTVATGSALCLGPTILPALEQLGLLQDIERMSFPCNQAHLLNCKLERLGTMTMKGCKEM